jgi:osmotically-inducible protein OsmY
MKTTTKYAVALMVAAAFLLVATVPLQASNSDNRIEKSAKKSYVFKTYLKDDLIKIESRDGIVTLTGTVSEETHKWMAEETVLGLPDVKSVSNQISVISSRPSSNTDASIAERIRGTLLFHRSVSYANTAVAVQDGQVTLRGKATSEAQKQLTTEYVSDVSGVTDVDNQMTVTKAASKPQRSMGEKIDDASITSQVRMSLLFHHGTDVFDTKVSTHKGVVTLSGTAMNQAEIDLASKRVGDIRGVKSVNNQMTIEVAQSSTN